VIRFRHDNEGSRAGSPHTADDASPGRRWYVASGALLLSGIACAALGAGLTLHCALQAPEQVMAPGTLDMTLGSAGRYTVSYEHKSVVNGDLRADSPKVPPLECRLMNRTTGVEVAAKPISQEYHYEVGPRAGVSVWEFNVESPGAYELSAWYPHGAGGPDQSVLVVARGLPWKHVAGAVALLPISLLLMVASGTILAVRLALRGTGAKTLDPHATHRHPETKWPVARPRPARDLAERPTQPGWSTLSP
jgi:hypothetical protein